MIYFARHIEHGYIKIGYTRHIARVAKRLKIEYGDIVVIGAMEGGYKDETRLHHQFQRYSIHEHIAILPETKKRRGWGLEWYISCNELLNYIASNSKDELMQSTVSEPGGRQKGRKYSTYLQMPCTPEFREEVEKGAMLLRMTVPEFMRYTISLHMEAAKNVSPHDQSGEYLMHLLRTKRSLSD